MDAAVSQPAREAEVDDEWRRWIAENLMLGVASQNILAAMTQAGVGQDVAVREFALAAASPYIGGARRLANRLRKRDWQLAVEAKLRRMRADSRTIDRRHRLSRDEFFYHYYTMSRPVVITGMIDDWPAMRRWSLDYFARQFGDIEIEIQQGREANPDYEIERLKHVRRITMAHYVRLLVEAGSTNNLYCTANNNSHNRRALARLWDDIVQVPAYLTPDRGCDGFFWLGPKGSITPFHHDLTNNLMAQVIGRKRVRLVPPCDTPWMRNMAHVYSEFRGADPPERPNPSLGEPQTLSCTIGPGDLLFLPIGWWHHVEGLEISATMTFTNFHWDNDFHRFYDSFHEV
jgi:hypothetical protein